LPKLTASADFNGRLLNRIAAERFRETRTRAYFPKRTPIFGWSRAIPATAAACFILAFVFFGGLENLFNGDIAGSTAEVISPRLDDRYLTVQPVSDHALIRHEAVAKAGEDWAFQQQLARLKRLRQLINSVGSQNEFASFSSSVIESAPDCCQSRIRVNGIRGAAAANASSTSQLRMVSEGDNTR
jgi:hypothetical protein